MQHLIHFPVSDLVSCSEWNELRAAMKNNLVSSDCMLAVSLLLIDNFVWYTSIKIFIHVGMKRERNKAEHVFPIPALHPGYNK